MWEIYFCSQPVKDKSPADDTNYDDIEDSIPVNKVSNDGKYSDQKSHQDGNGDTNSDGKYSRLCFLGLLFDNDSALHIDYYFSATKSIQ